MEKPLLLIVDDEPDMGEFVGIVGESAGFDIEVTASSGAFQQSYLASSPSLIVMDIAMPEIDAIGLFSWLSDAGNTTPVILMSGYGDQMLSWASELGQEMGVEVVDTLTKPISFDELQAALSSSMPS